MRRARSQAPPLVKLYLTRRQFRIRMIDNPPDFYDSCKWDNDLCVLGVDVPVLEE